MEVTSEVTIGQIVQSRAGRDKDRRFFIVQIIDEQFVLIADGDLRKIEKPKQKKIKHLTCYNSLSEELKSKLERNEKVTNIFIRREIEKLGLV